MLALAGFPAVGSFYAGMSILLTAVVALKVHGPEKSLCRLS